MSWLNSVRNALSFVVPKKETTNDNLWHKCKGCGQMVFTKELEDNLWVCPHCDHHERIGPTQRFEMLFDDGKYEVIESAARSGGSAQVPRHQTLRPTG